jgi:antitoxin FitA
MATLVIRDLADEIKAQLRVQAAEHGRSMEAEARAILAAAVSGRRPARRLGSHIRDQVAEGVELDIPPRSDPARSVDLDLRPHR